MRVLYPTPKKISTFNPAMYSLAQEFVATGAFLTGFPDFQIFLQSIRLNSAVVPGIFAIPRMNQLFMKPAAPAAAINNPPARNLRSTTTTTVHEPDIDEEVVNVCLITFLQALTGAAPAVASEWTPQRFAFKTRFAKDKYEARTDGYHRVQDASKKVQAIAEVKRRERKLDRLQLEMQEVAEMVGWIMDNDH